MTTPSRTVHAPAGEQSLTFEREFAAPVELVFRAHVDPDLFTRWVGPTGTEVRVEHFDARTGGAFHYVVVGGGEWEFFGSYHEVTAPDRIVHTWEFANKPGRPTLETLRFVDLGDGRCRLEGRSLYTSPEHCAEMLAEDEAGGGMDENFDRLDALLPTLVADA